MLQSLTSFCCTHSTMEKFRDCGELQVAACQTLATLARSSDQSSAKRSQSAATDQTTKQIQTTMGKHNAVSIVSKAMRNHIGDDNVQVHGTRVLLALPYTEGVRCNIAILPLFVFRFLKTITNPRRDYMYLAGPR